MYSDQQQPPMGVPPGQGAPYVPPPTAYSAPSYTNGEGAPPGSYGPPPTGPAADYRDDPPPRIETSRDYRDGGDGGYRDDRYSSRRRSRSPQGQGFRRDGPPSSKPRNMPAPPPNPCLGVFGLSIRTRERDLEDEFSRVGQVEKVSIVYDQRTDRSRGFAFVTMANTEDASRAIQELNGIELQGRRVRVDFSTTSRPHQATPGEYMGFKRPGGSVGGSGDRYGRPAYSSGGRSRDYDRGDDHRSSRSYRRDSRSPLRRDEGRRAESRREKSPRRHRDSPPRRERDY